MNKKGITTIEVAVVFPVFLFLIIALMFLFIKSVNVSNNEYKQEELANRILITDSVIKKVGIVNVLFE